MDISRLIQNIPDHLKPKAQLIKAWVGELMNGSLETQSWKGFSFIPGFLPETAQYFNDEWKGLTEDDVVVATFPKTGSHWIGSILSEIQGSGGGSIDMFQMLEMGPKIKFEIMDGLPKRKRTYMTHLPADLLNLDKIKQSKAKIIYLMRNPKDQTVSWYHFTQKLPTTKGREFYPEDWNKFLEFYVAGKQETISRNGEWYPEHILSWVKAKEKYDINFMYYEDIKADPAKSIKQLAEFVGLPISDERAKEITHNCDIETQKKKSNDTLMLRKGGVGGWKDYFTVSQSDAMDREIEQKLKNTEIKFTYQL